MVRYSKRRISDLFHIIDTATEANVKGDALEELARLLFSKIPGIKFVKKDFFNRARSQEIDLGFVNFRHYEGLGIIEGVIIVECKSSADPTTSQETSWFIEKVRSKHQKFGFLFSLNGLTGDQEDKTRAHDIIHRAFIQDGIMIFLVTRVEILTIKSTEDFITLIQKKFTKLIFEEEIFYSE